LDFIQFLSINDILKLREILPDTVVLLADEVHDLRGMYVLIDSLDQILNYTLPIPEATKQFLKKCHEKDAMLHSAMPDLIIRLSANPTLTPEMFCTIMK
jgi:hypothetical protein